MNAPVLDGHSRWRLAATGALVFVVVRAAMQLSGVRFDDSPLGLSWQNLDPELLQHRLLESLLYQHSQPPAFDALLGSVLKLAGNASHAAFQVLFLAIGAALYATTFLLMRRLGVSRSCAFVASTIFAISPSCILYENYLFYTLPLALLTCLAGLCFAVLLERKTRASCVVFFCVVALLCLTHGLFHIFYFFACVAGVLATRLIPRGVVLSSAALPLLLVVALYAKNAMLFGQFTAGTWLGMNTAIRRVDALPVAERERLIGSGFLSDVARVPPFDRLTSYPTHYASVPTPLQGIAAVTAIDKANGEPNLNHVGYIAIAKHYLADTVFVVSHYPKILLYSLARGWSSYFESSSNYWFLHSVIGSSALLRAERAVFDTVIYGVPVPNAPGIVLLVVIPLAVAYAFRVALGRGQVARVESTRERRCLLVFCAGTITFVALVANTLNTIENNRLRFMTDPLTVALFAFWVQTWLAPRMRARNVRRDADTRASSTTASYSL